jgi:hypothetical protein
MYGYTQPKVQNHRGEDTGRIPMMDGTGQVTDFSKFDEMPIQLSQIISTNRYGVSRKRTEKNICTMETNNSRAREPYMFLGIVQMSFFAHCVPIVKGNRRPRPPLPDILIALVDPSSAIYDFWLVCGWNSIKVLQYV